MRFSFLGSRDLGDLHSLSSYLGSLQWNACDPHGQFNVVDTHLRLTVDRLGQLDGSLLKSSVPQSQAAGFPPQCLDAVALAEQATALELKDKLVAEQAHSLLELKGHNDKLDEKVVELNLRIEKLLQQLFGRKSERRLDGAGQLLLDNLFGFADAYHIGNE